MQLHLLFPYVNENKLIRCFRKNVKIKSFLSEFNVENKFSSSGERFFTFVGVCLLPTPIKSVTFFSALFITVSHENIF